MRKVDCTASVLDLGEAGELRALSTVMVLKTCENLSPNSSLSDCMAFRTESASLPGIRMAISISVPVLNLRKIQRALLRMLAYLLEILAQNKNWALVQWTLVRPLETGVVGHKSYILLFSYSSIFRVQMKFYCF